MRLLVTGAGGQLGSYLLRELRARDEQVIAWSGAREGELFGTRLRPVDLTRADTVVAAFREARPQAILHAAACSSVGACFHDPDRAAAVNVGGTRLLAELGAESRARLVFVSTDLVFDGEGAPYREDALPVPLSVYGGTKAAAEPFVLDVWRGSVVRVGLLFGPAINGRPAFFDQQLAALRNRTPCTLFADEWRTPLSLRAAAQGLLSIALSDHEGLLHMGGPERLSRLEMGQRLARWLGLDAEVLVAGRRAEAPAAEPRPRDVSLDSGRWRAQFAGSPWPTLEEALREAPSGETI